MIARLRDLAGQEDAARRLEAALQRGRLHHALLLSGPDGSGKFTAAKLLAQILMCQDADLQRREPGAACGHCPGCVKVAGAGHADVHVLQAEESSLKVDHVREATQALHIRPREGRFRILIIRDADLMTVQAQNALLKTLEEPPGAARLFLTTSRPQAILLTVLSRCQKVPFRPVPAGAIVELLTKQRELPPARAQLLAALARGAPGRALSADAAQIVEDRDRMAAIDLALEGGAKPSSVPEALHHAEELLDDPERQKDRLRERLELYSVWLRDQVLLASGAPDAGDELANRDRLADVESCAQRGLTEVLRRARVVEHTRAQLDLPYNLNVPMIVEQLCLGLAGHSMRAELERRAPTRRP